VNVKKSGHDFEGIIYYKINYYDSNGDPVNDKRLKYLGDSMKVFMQKGNYKQIYSGSFVECVSYDYKSNKYYTSFKDIDTVSIRDAGVQDDSIAEYGKIDSAITILGNVCSGYKISTSQTNCYFFYSPNIYKNPKYFIQHRYFGYDKFIRDTHSIYLQLEIEYKNISIVFTATSIQWTKLKDKLFTISKVNRVYNKASNSKY